MGIEYWAVCSSSSGKTFENVFSKLESSEQKSCLGLFSDRTCGALKVGASILGPERVFEFGRKREFEEMFLRALEPVREKRGLVFLCGFFGILSESFLAKCPWPIVNTHPSLLPAFPGLDEKVHQEAFEKAHYSGFSVHLVNEQLDGGAILYQEPVDIRGAKTWEEARDLVRTQESARLPEVLQKLFKTNLSTGDRHKSTREILNVLQY